MDLMEVRRRLMMRTASGKIQTKTFVVNKTYSNTGALGDDIKTKLGVESFIAVSKRDVGTFEQNGIYCIYIIDAKKVSRAMHGGLRYRNNSWGTVTVGASYDVSIPIGDEYTVYILDNQIDI